MNWRTDKPTANIIVVFLKGSCYPQVLEYDKDKQCYLEEHNSPVNIQDIEKWADLEEDETVTETDCNEFEEECDKWMINELQGFLASFGSDYFGTGEWQKFDDWLEKQKDIEDRWIEDREQCFWNGVEEGKMLAEKQKEQKPDTRDADDLQLLGFIYDLLNEIKWKDSWAMSKDECLQRLNDYRPQKPAEWSEYMESQL